MGGQRSCGVDGGQHIRAWLIRRGGVDIESGKGLTHIAAGHWVIAMPGHAEEAFSPGAKALLVCFECVWPTGEGFFRETVSRSFPGPRYPQMEGTALALLAYVKENIPGTGTALPDAVTDLPVFLGLRRRMDAWLEAFVSALTAEGAVPSRLGIADQRIERALRLLDAWRLDLPLDRQRVAHEARVSAAHLDRLFTAHVHLTPSRYFDCRRLEHARRRLCQTEVRIKELSAELGFHSEAHFSHWFKNHEHACPRLFRQDHVGREGEGRPSAPSRR